MNTDSQIKYGRILILILILLPWTIFIFVSSEKLNSLTKEDGVVESIGALFLLTSAVLFFITFLKDRDSNDLFIIKTSKNYFFLFFAILFFFAFGEELSWGQRIFNLKAPEILDEINYQREINFHNLKIFSEFGLLNANHIATLLGVTYCLIIPLLYNKWPFAKKMLNKINLPIVPAWLSLFILFSYSLSLMLKFGFGYTQSATEVKETSISFLFVIFSITCLTKDRDKHFD